MHPKEVRNQLSLYLGLDDETIDAAVVPHLNSLGSRAELQDYLTGLLGNDTAQASFIRAYAESRFPIAKAAPPAAPPTSKGSRVPLTAPASSLKAPQKAAASASNLPLTAPGNRTASPLLQPSAASTSSSRAPSPIPRSNAASPAPGRSSPRPPEEMPEAVQEELFQIDKRLRFANGTGKKVACFCQAQQHPISPVSPMCARCLLVICDLNVPYTNPCPSCSYAPLASGSTLSSYIASLQHERDALVHAEAERARLESEEVERERRAIQFPTLEGSAGYGQTMTNPAGYASKAGGTDHYKRIDQLYKDAQAREAADREKGERRVLTLNTKTHKVKVQTTKAKANASAAGKGLAKKDQRNKEEWDDARTPYVDENDDGITRNQPTQTGTAKPSIAKFAWPAPSGLKYQFSGASSTSAMDEDDDDSVPRVEEPM